MALAQGSKVQPIPGARTSQPDKHPPPPKKPQDSPPPPNPRNNFSPFLPQAIFKGTKKPVKKVNIYGVEMTSLQEMMFAKYRDLNGISMNTFNKEERCELAQNWLNNHLPDTGKMV